MSFKDANDSIEEILKEFADIKFNHTSYAACFKFDSKFFVKKPLRPEAPYSVYEIMNVIYEHQMLQVLRFIQNQSIFSFQEMFVLNEDRTKIVDYYAYRRCVKTLADI